MSFPRLFKFLLAILALAGLLCSQAMAQVQAICLDTANPPFMYASADGKAAGVYPAILAEAFRRMDMPVDIQAMPWKRALAMATAGETGIGGIYKNSERLKFFDFSDVLYTERIVVVTMANRNLTFTGLESLKGIRVGVLRGWSYGDDFDKSRREGLFIAEDVDGDGQNLSKLRTGRIDAMLAVMESAEMHLAASGKREIFTLHKTPLAQNDAYLAFAKSAGKKDLLTRFNTALASMRRDGTLEKMVLSLIAKP